MATTAAGRALTQAHRIGQARLAAQLTQRLLAAWPLLDPRDLAGTIERWLTVAEPLVSAGYASASDLSAAYYGELRRVEVGGTFSIPRIGPIDLEALRTSLTVTGPVAIKSGQDPADAAAGSAAAGARHATNGGRSTITTAMDEDPTVVGYRRSVAPGCCAFCAMLASRGAVYSRTSVDFRAHDRCMCQPEPIWHETPPTRQEQHFRDLWDSSADFAEFRRAVERQPIG